ncbi:Casein kinase substrate, phosphoprotein PP28 [Moelleriella libera RCEF 2490]|uniref:Casein kinase substrate, phosphoprotein PP28 n=1 Tax=Moelleriella libera RCEF 2490 TaxID=1081109 RepID=A0A167Z387_9HYPO|nr:Casein kinase substrate, phosphoprotein PP28 [Moelleriella libera RCEF 2490]
MAGGATTSARGRAGKFNKPTRGGGKKFSRNLQPVDADGNQVSMWSADKEDDQSEGEEDSSEEDEEDEDGDGQQGGATQGSTENRDDRKALKKARKEAAIAKQKSRTIEVGDMPSSDEDGDDGMPANPNHSKSARKQAKASDPIEEVTEGVKKMAAPGNRKEREALEAAAARERYLKLQAEGKTDQAQADLARLRLIREQRAADAARRQAEKEERDEQEKARRAEIEAREAKKREAAAAPKKAGKKK